MKPYQTKEWKMKNCEHDWFVENRHQSKKELQPLNAFHGPYLVNITIIAHRCKKCGKHEVIEI